MSTEPILLARGVEKRFPGVHALSGVDLDVRAGEVHALMGQNGAGKSTLIKILTGVHARDGGTLTFEGRDFRPTSPGDAQARGISTIYQELSLIPTLTVAENLFLGRAPRRWFGLDWGAMRREAERILATFDLHSVDVTQPLGTLSAAVQQLVAIARAVQTRARVIIMDEPTSSLDTHETEVLLDTIVKLKQRGLGIVFVTHFLDQVYRVSDRITVLRNGANVGTYEASQLSRLDLVSHMLGKVPEDVEPALHEHGPSRGPVVADAKALERRGVPAFDLTLHEGEVVGFAGLLGSGRTEAARLLFGADAARSGTLDGAAPGGPRDAIAKGMAFLPEDRKAEGIFPELSVRENIAIVVQRKLGLVLSHADQVRLAEEFVQKLGIKTPSVEQPIRLLSGGNQQKVILARWLAYEPRLLILDEPTRGIDVGAKGEIERLIQQLSRKGLAVLFISAALEEVLRLSHRIAVFRDRKKVGELSQTTLPEVLKMIASEEGHAR